MIPEIDLKGSLPVKDIIQSDLLLKGAEQFVEHGVLIVKNVFDPDYLKTLNDTYLSQYKEYCTEKMPGDDHFVGHKRSIATINIEAPFNLEHLYANSKIMPLLKHLLGSNLILNNLGSVTSLPGSQEQHIHRDMENIYLPTIKSKGDDSWLANLPVYAITVGIPLVPITPLTGNTRFWPGTHHTSVSHRDPNLPPGEDFTCDLGSCVFFDYRVIHAGAANMSDQIRPLLYAIYSRDWFRDNVNYDKLDALSITVDEYNKIPEQHQSLFSWAIRNQLKPSQPQKKLKRNDPCFCNSGLKYKRCHGKT